MRCFGAGCALEHCAHTTVEPAVHRPLGALDSRVGVAVTDAFDADGLAIPDLTAKRNPLQGPQRSTRVAVHITGSVTSIQAHDSRWIYPVSCFRQQRTKMGDTSAKDVA
jgi:hypothetical protein